MSAEVRVTFFADSERRASHIAVLFNTFCHLFDVQAIDENILMLLGKLTHGGFFCRKLHENEIVTWLVPGIETWDRVDFKLGDVKIPQDLHAAELILPNNFRQRDPAMRVLDLSGYCFHIAEKFLIDDSAPLSNERIWSIFNVSEEPLVPRTNEECRKRVNAVAKVVDFARKNNIRLANVADFKMVYNCKFADYKWSCGSIGNGIRGFILLDSRQMPSEEMILIFKQLDILFTTFPI